MKKQNSENSSKNHWLPELCESERTVASAGAHGWKKKCVKVQK